MNNFLLTLAGLLLAVLCALFAVPPLIDWNQYRGVFEEEVSRFLGREVRVGGDVRLRILPVPYVGFDRVHIADAPGVSGPFVQAGRFTMWLAVPPLLRGVIEARRIEISKPTLRLRFDEKGGGNWQSLRFSETGLPFVPRQIALQSVNIVSGRLIVENTHGDTIARLEGIDGELSAVALPGPYKFIGTYGAAEERRELRLSTSRAGADGSLRIKASVRDRAAKSSTVIDGALSNLTKAPTFAGTFRVRASNDLLVSTPPPTQDAKRKPNRRFFEASGKISADSRAARLVDISISFDSDGRPQLLKGTAEATWQRALQIHSRLSSRWLDLDAIFGLEKSASPLSLFNAFLQRRNGIGQSGRAVLDIAVDQANLGGASIGDLFVRFGREGKAVRIERLHAALPGGTSLSGDGLIGSGSSGGDFDGFVILKGASLRRFTQWARLPSIKLRGRAATSFAIRSSVKYSPGALLLENLAAETAGGTVRGDMQAIWGAKPRLAIDLDVANVDLYGFGDNLLAQESLTAAFGTNAAASKLPQDHPSRLFDGMDLRIRLDGTNIRDGARHLKTIDLTVHRTGKKLVIDQAKFSLASGITADLKGNLTSAGTRHTGELTGVVTARTANGVRALVELVSGLTNTALSPDFLRNAYPISLAFSAGLGRPDKHATSITADGEVNGDRVRIALTTGGGVAGWRNQPLRLSARIEGRDVGHTIGWLRARPPQNSPQGAPQAASAPGTTSSPVAILIESSGQPASGLTSAVHIDSAVLALRLDSTAKLGQNDTLVWQGRAETRTPDLARAAQIFAPELLPAAARVPASGRIDLAGRSGSITISPRGAMIGLSRVDGRITLQFPHTPRDRHRLTAELAVDKARMRDLLAPLSAASTGLAPRTTENGGADGRGSQSASFWSDAPFSFAPLNGVEGKIALTVAILDVGQGLKARKTSFAAQLTPSNVAVSQFGGRLLGGTVTGSANLSAAPAGAAFSGSLKLSGIDLASLATSPLSGRLSGHASGELALKGTALSLRALVATMTGTGNIQLKQAVFPGLPHEALSALCNEIVAGKLDAPEIAAKITAATRLGAVRVGNATAKLTVADGALLFSRVATGSEAPRAENRTTVDLLQLASDSEWRVWPQLSASPDIKVSKPLPEIRVVYAAPLAKLPSAVAAVSLGSLERELTVRRMEADVARLERLRREDEARAKAEAERLRRLEEERQRAVEAERQRRLQEQQQQSPVGVAPQPGQPPATPAPAPVRARPPLPAPVAPVVPPPQPGGGNRSGSLTPPVQTTPQPPSPAATTAPLPTVTKRPRRKPHRRRSNWSPNRALEQLNGGTN
ncbi:MAG: AsmA family protein [Hyphomicrobiaceae bacterium]|nr:AsmA family protein [Hyphomicrobiaceae bacterium]